MRHVTNYKGFKMKMYFFMFSICISFLAFGKGPNTSTPCPIIKIKDQNVLLEIDTKSGLVKVDGNSVDKPVIINKKTDFLDENNQATTFEKILISSGVLDPDAKTGIARVGGLYINPVTPSGAAYIYTPDHYYDFYYDDKESCPLTEIVSRDALIYDRTLCEKTALFQQIKTCKDEPCKRSLIARAKPYFIQRNGELKQEESALGKKFDSKGILFHSRIHDLSDSGVPKTLISCSAFKKGEPHEIKVSLIPATQVKPAIDKDQPGKY